MKKIKSLKSLSATKKLILLGFVAILLISCAKDILVQPPNSLRGFYVGRFYVTKNYSSSENAITDYVNVQWTFTDYTHQCLTEVAEGQDLNLCSFRGDYTVENQLIFSGTRKAAIEVCDDEFMPDTNFSIQWIYGSEAGGLDTLVLQQRDNITDTYYQGVIEKQPDNTVN